MKVVIVGATGNVGTSLLSALADEPSVDEIVGVARRKPDAIFAKTQFLAADISRDDLTGAFTGADAVVHLAWLIQPSRDLDVLGATNVTGSERVFRAALSAKVPRLVYASSVGAYSPGPKRRAVDESWPTRGIASSFYSRHKAATERMLDEIEAEDRPISIVRLRPGLIFKKEAASGIRRLFMGPFVPNRLLRPGGIPIVPKVQRLVFQAVHSFDVADAYRRALVSDVKGPFNIAADPVLDPDELARLLDARKLPMPASLLRPLVGLTWKARMHPTPPGWLDMGLGVPVMSTRRARDELGWNPLRTSGEALVDLLQGLHEGSGIDTPPLSPLTGGRFRTKELVSGVGARP